MHPIKHILTTCAAILFLAAPARAVTAPQTVTFMGKQFYFSHWQILEDTVVKTKKEAEETHLNIGERYQPEIFLYKRTFSLPKNKRFYVDYRGVPHITVYYYPAGETKKSHSEAFLIETDGHPNPYEYDLTIVEDNQRRGAPSVPPYTCGDSTDTARMLSLPGSFSVSKSTKWGNLSWQMKRSYQTKGSKTRQFYRDKICEYEYPEWMKDMPVMKYARKETDTGKKPTVHTPKNTPIGQLKKEQTINYRGK